MSALRFARLSLARLSAALLLCLLALSLTALPPASAANLPPITYTGQLIVGTSPVANGSYDLQFSLYTAATGGTQVGSTVTAAAVPVVDGVFYVELNFTNAIMGQTLYLQTAYRLTGGSSYTTQTPRKLLPQSAYADYATLSGNTKRLQNNLISTAAPTAGQVLTWTGTLWTPETFALTPPVTLSASSSSPILSAVNSGSGSAVSGKNAGSGDYGLLGGVEPADHFPAGVIGMDVVSSQGGDIPSSYGVYGSSSVAGVGGFSADGYGVYGNSGGSGVFGASAGGFGVFGLSDTGYGGYFTSTTGPAVYGTIGNGASGFLGGTDPNFHIPVGVYGSDTSSSGGHGVGGSSVNGSGVYGYSPSGYGVFGFSPSGDGVFGESGNGNAGYFIGNVTVTGSLTVMNDFSAGSKNFKIDHPLDPGGKFLTHSCIESSEMADLYSGNVTTDAYGNATVTMPGWFQALNKDFRYQLTCIGQFAQAIVGTEMAGNQFTIKTDKPHVKVSWQVTGIRQDAYAAAHPLQVEEDKPAAEQGLYLHPKEWGQPEERGIGYAQRQAHLAHGPK